MEKPIPHYSLAFLAVLLTVPMVASGQASDYLPGHDGITWNYNTQFSDIMDDWADEIPEESVEQDSLASIVEQDDMTVYTIFSRLLPEDADESGDEKQYNWFVHDNMISPEFGAFKIPDNLNNMAGDLARSVPTPQNPFGALLQPAEDGEGDIEFPEFLPVFDFNRTPGDSWEIITITDVVDTPQNNGDEQDDLFEIFDEMEINMQMHGNRHSDESFNLDGNSYDAAVFSTVTSVEITLMDSDGAAPDITIPVFDEYTLTSHWVESRGLVQFEADSHIINFGSIDFISFGLAQVNDNSDEFVVPGHSTQMSNYNEGDATSTQHIDSETPQQVELSQNYPNPFNPSTTITYAIPEGNHVQLNVYDITGRKVATLVDQVQQPGTYQAVWNGAEHASGIYIYRLETGNSVHINRMTLVK